MLVETGRGAQPLRPGGSANGSPTSRDGETKLAALALDDRRFALRRCGRLAEDTLPNGRQACEAELAGRLEFDGATHLDCGQVGDFERANGFLRRLDLADEREPST